MVKASKEQIDAFASIFTAEHWDCFGTFTFKDGTTIAEESALSAASRFLCRLDQLYFGNQVKRRDIRIPRAVFMETIGSKGDYRWVHFHIYFRSYGNRHIFSHTLKRLWKQCIYNANDARIDQLQIYEPWDENYKNGIGYYGWKKDQWMLGEKSFQENLTYAPRPLPPVSQNALSRIYKLHTSVGRTEFNDMGLYTQMVDRNFC